MLQVAHRHAGQAHPGEEHESAYRFRVVAAVTEGVSVDVNEPGAFVVAQGVR